MPGRSNSCPLTTFSSLCTSPDATRSSKSSAVVRLVRSTNVATLKAGSLRALAVSTPRRLPALPNIPTFAELGFAKLTGSQWLGLSAPKGLPAPIAQRLAALIPDVLARPDVAARLEELQTLPRSPNPVGDDFVQLVRSQLDSWRAVARSSNVEVIT